MHTVAYSASFPKKNPEEINESKKFQTFKIFKSLEGFKPDLHNEGFLKLNL